MQAYDLIKEYCNKVSEQIRWKKAKPVIYTEIENHLCDQRDAYIADGDNENIATEKAIKQMGDAVLIGQELDKTHKPKPQLFMILIIGILISIGAFINYIIGDLPDSVYNFSVLPYILAFIVFICCYYADFTLLGKYADKIYIVTLAFCIVNSLFASDFGIGAQWFLPKPFMSRYISLILPLVFSLFVYIMRNKGSKGIFISVLAYFPFVFILFRIPTLAGVILYTVTAFIVLYFALYKGWFACDKNQGLIITSAIALMVFIFGVINFLFRYSRELVPFLNAEQYKDTYAFIYYTLRDVIKNSYLFGSSELVQNFQSIEVLNHISVDYLLTYLIYKFGLICLVLIIALVTLFCVVGIRKMLKQKSVLGSLVTLSIIITFVLQIVLAIFDNLGYGLISSLGMPFIIYGKSGLFINSALAGFMLSVFRTGDIFKDNYMRKTNPFILYKDGKLVIDLNGD